MSTISRKSEIDQLRELNIQIADAELNRNVDFMSSVLSDQLSFTRATGVTVDKQTYLKELADNNNIYTQLIILDNKVKYINHREAMATVIIKAAGRRGKDHVEFDGIFKNERHFIKEKEWKLDKWKNSRFPNKTDNSKDFFKDDYALKVNFYTAHLGRIWQRFNFFLAAETTLFAGKVFFTDKPQYHQNEIMFIGLSISIIWYLMGAQDKYLVELYRQQVKESFLLYRLYSFPENLPMEMRHAGEVTQTAEDDIRGTITQWRNHRISTTTLAALIPLTLIIMWTILLIVNN